MVRMKRQADLMSELLLAAPVFLVYQIGLLLSPRAANGADFFTRSLGALSVSSTWLYLAAMAVLVVAYAMALGWLRAGRSVQVKRFPVVLLESTVYALLMGPLAGLLLRQLHLLGGWVQSMGPVDRIVASAGAGFYEELVFRLGGVGLLAWGLGKSGMARGKSLLWAVLASSLLFSAVHYIGPGSDAFGLGSFVFRFVLGAMLAVIFHLRGFATAVYAHALYDVYVMLVLLN